MSPSGFLIGGCDTKIIELMRTERCLLVIICLGLSGCAEQEVETNIRRLSDPDSQIRMEATLNLIGYEDATVLPLIASATAGGDSLQYIAAQILGQIGDARAGDLLCELNQSNNIYVRREALLALGKLGDKSHIPLLLQMLKIDKASSIRSAAAQSLGILRDSTSIPDLIKAFDDEDALVRRRVLAALHYQWTSTVEVIAIRALTDPDQQIRYIAAQMLGMHRAPKALVALCLALRDSSIWVRAEAANALSNLGDTSAVGDLERLFKNSEGADHQAASKALRALTGIEYLIQ